MFIPTVFCADVCIHEYILSTNKQNKKVVIENLLRIFQWFLKIVSLLMEQSSQ